MRPSRTRSIARAILVLGGAGVIALMTTMATALSTVTATDVAPALIKASSGQVTVFGVNLTTSPSLTDTLTGAKVVFSTAGGFATSDLAGDTGNNLAGVQLIRDNGATADVLDGSDTQVSTTFTFACPDSCTATLTIPEANNAIPTAAEGSYTYFVVIRTSSSISNGDSFTVTLPQDAFTTAPTPTTLAPPDGVTSKTITADTAVPSAPNGDNLGLMRAAGKVRSGGTAASTETSGVLEVLRSSSPLCNTGVVSVTEGPQTDLTATNADLVGSTAGEIAALQAFPTGSTYVCYRVRDAAGNLSPIVADGTVPAAPSASTLSLLSVSNASGIKRVYAAADPSGPRTFRLYIRPGGSGVDRSKSDGGGFVEITTSSSAVTTSGTTNILRFGDDSALAANDGIAYALVSSGTGVTNDGALGDDGTIPSAPVSGDLSILSASAAAGNQRVIAGQDSSVRTFGLYIDPAGGTAWARGVTASSGTTPVRVTTSTSAGTDSGTTTVFSGATALAATHAVGYVTVNPTGGNESDVTADGTIPDVPSVADIAFSDARNLFVVATDPYPADTKFSLYVGDSESTASTAYDGTPDGVATSNTAVSVSEFDAESKLFYTRTNVLTGNESAAAQDGAIPAAPTGATSILATSAAQSNQKVTSVADASGPRTFRLYVDVAGGQTPSWTRAVTTSGGTTLVEITTALALPADSGTTAIFAGSGGTTALADGHKVGFAFDDTDGNETDVAQDGAIPAAPATSGTRASDAEDKFYLPTASATNTIKIFLDPSATPATAYANGADATATSSPWDFGSDLPEGEFVHYTTLNADDGNESAIVTDGVIPAPDANLDDIMSATAAGKTITANLDPSGPRTITLFGDPLGGTAYVLATTTSGGSTPVSVLSDTDESVESSVGIFFGTTEITAGASLAYGVTNSNGNDADLTADGTIPAAPADASLFSASAAADEAIVAASAASQIYRVFDGTDPIGYLDHTMGTPTMLAHDFTGGETVGWAITSGSGNESPVLADGTIPAAPAASTLSGSARTGSVTATGATATNNVLVFVGSSDDAAAAYDGGVDVTLTSASPGSFSLSPGHFLFYTVKNTTSGNESAVTADGSVPSAPSLPAAATLLQAGDGGSGAPAATINSVGAPAVTLRPGIALAASGQSVVLRVEKGAIVLGSATSVSGSSVTPVFGGTTSGVTYGSDDQNTSTGALDLSALTDGSDVAVQAAFSNANGNESPLSSAVNVTKDTSAPAAPSDLEITPASPSTDNTPSVTGTVDGGTSSVTVTFDAPGTTNDRSITVTPSSGTFSVGSAEWAAGLPATGEPPAQPLADETYVVTAAAKDTVGNPASAVVHAAYVVDTTAPAAPAVPDLNSGSDSGVSSTDNITNVQQPTFTITGVENGATVTLLDGATAVGSQTAAGTSVSITLGSNLTTGVHQMKARQTDTAGNVSSLSAALPVTIDITAPTATFAKPGSLTDGGTFTYNETVSGPTTANTVLRLAGDSANIPASVTCRNSSGSVTACSGSAVKSVGITPTSSLSSGQDYDAYTGLTGQAAITDLAGNALAQVKSTFTVVNIVEENSSQIAPVWGYVRATSALGGTYRHERSFRSMAIFRGTGSYYVWYTVTGPDMGMADVWIDNAYVGTWNQYSPTVKYGVTRAFRLSPGLHTFAIVVKGQKSTVATDTKVVVDAIQLDATVFNTPEVEYRMAPRNFSTASGGMVAESDLYGAQWNFGWSGTGIIWYSLFGPDRGKSIVYIDGVNMGIYDMYRPTFSIGLVRFTGLSNGPHRIQIVALGTRSPGSSGTFAGLDRLHGF